MWHIEEKQTDVNLAIHSLRDAFTDTSEQLHIFISNDSDLAPLVDMLAGLPHIRTGIIAPIRNADTRPSGLLVKNADWSTGALQPELLSAAQMPFSVQGQKKPIRKPIEWFGASTIATEVFAVLFNQMRKRNAVYQWLEQEPYPANLPNVSNLHKPAIEMLDYDTEARLVLTHAKAYADYLKNKAR